VDDVLAEAVGTATSYSYKNMLSSLLQLADSTAAVSRIYNYSAWGESTNWPALGTDNNPYGYTGREWESTESYYYRARMYTPGAGRFMSRDPILDLSWYPYVRNTPLVFVDPMGKEICGIYVEASNSGWRHEQLAWPGGGATFGPLNSSSWWYLFHPKGDTPHGATATGGCDPDSFMHREEVYPKQGTKCRSCKDLYDCLENFQKSYNRSYSICPLNTCWEYVDQALDACGLRRYPPGYRPSAPMPAAMYPTAW
jgi:RHS repeat-associated protein